MMFERYKASFNWVSATDPSQERDTGSGPREPDLPFDQKLRQKLLGAEAAAPLTLPPGAPELPDAQPGGRDNGREILAMGSWQILRQPRRAQQNAALALRSRSDEVKHATDVLRTQLLQTLKAKGWRRVAVTAPSSGCGTTFTALNLALSMAAIPDVRTVLLDLNQRRPGLAGALGASGVHSIADMLRNKVSFIDHLQRYADNLAIGLNTDIPENPAEILQSRAAAEAMDDLTDYLEPDVVLCDMPPLLEHDDLTAFLPQVDAVLVVADATRTVARELAECQKALDGKAPLLGVVLNRGRAGRRRPGR